ncbi:MAG: T9SS type A sorting domain-containing protein [Bacteroidota bacterium]
MKIILLVFALTCFLTINRAFSQSYVPLPDSNASWGVGYYYFLMACGPDCWDKTVVYYTNGDSLIGSYKYNRISCRVMVNSILSGNTSIPPNFFLRQDKSMKRVYKWDKGDRRDLLYYDFDLYVGSRLINWYTVPLKYTFMGEIIPDSYATVTSIDSVYVGAAKRKRYRLDRYCDLIEGVGLTSGIGERSDPCFDWRPQECGQTKLHCFNGNMINPFTISQPDHGQCNTAIVSVKAQEKVAEDLHLQISPNPVGHGSDIKVGFSAECEAVITIYSALGQKLSEHNLRADNTDLSLSLPSAGIYKVHIQAAGRSNSQTLVVY